MTNNILDANYRNEIVTYGLSVLRPWELYEKPLGSIMEEIKSNEELSKSVSEIRSTTEKTEKNNLKKGLPYFSLPRFENRRSNDYFVSTSSLLFDIDNLNDVDTVKETLKNWEYTYFLFTSPSGSGLKLGVYLEKSITDMATYSIVYRNTQSKIDNLFKIKTDKTSDPARACFLSYDPDLYYNSNSTGLPLYDTDDWDLSGDSDYQIFPIYDIDSSTQNASEIAFPNASEGERNITMTRFIGKHIGDRKHTKEDIFHFIKKWNIGNNPPLTEEELSREFEAAYKSISNRENAKLIVFWRKKLTATNASYEVDRSALYRYLTEEGFFKIVNEDKYDLIQIKQNIIYRTNHLAIIDYIKNYIKQTVVQDFDEILEAIIRFLGSFHSSDFLSILETTTPKIKQDTKNAAYLYFKNLFLEITANSIIPMSYDSLGDELVYENNIINHRIDLSYNNLDQSEYDKLLLLVCGNENEWAKSLRSALGYLIHTYKDPANTKAIILCDEEIPFSDDANGGTGKSLILSALKYVRYLSTQRGKSYDGKDKFAFQTYEPGTRIFFFDDVRKNFDFESLFSIITGDLYVEKKNRGAEVIGFKESPKIAISTNFTVNGRGASYRRRMHEVALSPYFSEEFTPLDKFGHRLFDDWSEEQWNIFYLTLASYVQLYLSEGLIEYIQPNLNIRKIINSASKEFFDFMQENLVLDELINKKEFFEKYIAEYPDFQRMNQRTFTLWVKIYSEEQKLKLEETKSGTDRFYRITNSNEVPAPNEGDAVIEVEQHRSPF